MHKPDVKVLFSFISLTRTSSYKNGYRCDHLIKPEYLTCGEHHYDDIDGIPPLGSGRGTITFIQPEAYQHCLHIGKKILLCEGERLIGSATVISVLNPLLLAQKNPE